VEKRNISQKKAPGQRKGGVHSIEGSRDFLSAQGDMETENDLGESAPKPGYNEKLSIPAGKHGGQMIARLKKEKEEAWKVLWPKIYRFRA